MKNKNLLKGCHYYTGGPFEYNNDSNASGWRRQVDEELAKIGCKHLDPMGGMFMDDNGETDVVRADMRQELKNGNWDKVVNYFSNVIYRDARAIDLSSFVIFNWHNWKIPTFGTHTELYISTVQRKPIFIICEDIDEVPFWILGLIKKKQYFYDSVESCIDMIKKIDSGEVEIDSKRWKILREDLR